MIYNEIHRFIGTTFVLCREHVVHVMMNDMISDQILSTQLVESSEKTFSFFESQSGLEFVVV